MKIDIHEDALPEMLKEYVQDHCDEEISDTLPTTPTGANIFHSNGQIIWDEEAN